MPAPLEREQNLCEAVSSWLCYKSLTGLRGLINESSIKVPISEFLSTSSKNEIDAEVAHPLFKTNTRGRPRQIDYVVKRNGTSWLAIYECKYHEDTAQRIIHDICRLLSFNSNLGKGNPDRYFLYAGKLTGTSPAFRVDVNTGQNQRLDVLSTLFHFDGAQKGTKKGVVIDTLHEKIKSHFVNFCKDYKAPLPETFDTLLCGSAQSGEHACYLWRLMWRKGTNSKLVEAA